MTNKLILQTALYQMDSTWKSPEHNIKQLAIHLRTLPPTTDLLVLPEMWTTGFVMDPEQTALPLVHPIVDQITALAEAHDIAIVGSMSVADDGKYYNRALLHTSQGIAHTYDKQYLFSPSGEGDSYLAGSSAEVFNYKGWSIQLQICYDLRFPEGNRSAIQPDLIIYMANWPAARIYHWQHLLIARAIENQCYVIGCNRIGTDGNGWTFPGQSQIVDYAGQPIAIAADTSSSAAATIDKEALQAYRAKFPFYQDKK